MGNALKREMLRISLKDVERVLQEAKAETATYTTELADSEHRQHHDMLVRNASNITASVHDTKATITTLENDIRECKSRLDIFQVQERSATAARSESENLGWMFSRYRIAPPPPWWKPRLGRISPSPRASELIHIPSTQARQPRRKWHHHRPDPLMHAFPPKLSSSALPWTPAWHRPLPTDGQNRPPLGPRSTLGDPNHTPIFLRTTLTWTSECRAYGTVCIRFYNCFICVEVDISIYALLTGGRS